MQNKRLSFVKPFVISGSGGSSCTTTTTVGDDDFDEDDEVAPPPPYQEHSHQVHCIPSFKLRLISLENPNSTNLDRPL